VRPLPLCPIAHRFPYVCGLLLPCGRSVLQAQARVGTLRHVHGCGVNTPLGKDRISRTALPCPVMWCLLPRLFLFVFCFVCTSCCPRAHFPSQLHASLVSAPSAPDTPVNLFRQKNKNKKKGDKRKRHNDGGKPGGKKARHHKKKNRS